MAVDEQDIGSSPESIDDGLDRRKLSKRKIRRNVRELDLELTFNDVENLQALGVEGDRGSERLVSDVGHVGAAERSQVPEVILLPHTLREALLF